MFVLNQVSKTYLPDIGNLHTPTCFPYMCIFDHKILWVYLHLACAYFRTRQRTRRPSLPRSLGLDSYTGRVERICSQNSKRIHRYICSPIHTEDFRHIQICFGTNNCHLCHITLVAVYQATYEFALQVGFLVRQIRNTTVLEHLLRVPGTRTRSPGPLLTGTMFTH